MNSMGWSVEGVPDRDGRGELRAESLPKAAFPGGRLCGFAMAARSWEKWARVLFRTQSGVELRLYVKCRGGEEVCEKRVLSLGRNQVPYIGIFSQP